MRTHSLSEAGIDFALATAETENAATAATEGLAKFLKLRGVERKTKDPFASTLLEWIAITQGTGNG